jgi:hypothetical protein
VDDLNNLSVSLGKARALIARFEARLRAQGRQRGGKYRERLPLLKAGKLAFARFVDDAFSITRT